MKTCPKGHPFDPGRIEEDIYFEVPCPFCVLVRRSRAVKAALLAAATLAVLGEAGSRMEPLAVLGSIGSVLIWVPAWLGVAMATLGNLDLMPWAYWFYFIAAVFFRTPAGTPAWHAVLDLLRFLSVPPLHPETTGGWWAVGLLQGFLLGLVGVSLDVFMRRVMNEPDPPKRPWVLKAFQR